MKYVFFVLAIIISLASIPLTEAISVYNPATHGYQTIQPYSYNTPTILSWNNQPPRTNPYQRYVGATGRPEGYMRVQQPISYPHNRYLYQHNNQLLGHTSAWTPGRFYSGVNGQRMTQPNQRPQTNSYNTPRTYNPNVYTWY
ncbi:MAG: hypothetical protein ACMXYD_00395 [Candidatus Woesearchaeota archaeon]